MNLDVVIDGKSLTLQVPPDLVAGAEDFFAKMDDDMSKGWQMSRRYVDNPSAVQRCQIAADRLLTAVHTDNQSLLMMMAGYIVSRCPGVRSVDIDCNGEIFNTRFVLTSGEVLSDSVDAAP